MELNKKSVTQGKLKKSNKYVEFKAHTEVSKKKSQDIKKYGDK